MNASQVATVVAEIERRWRDRTPAKSVADASPDDRVNRSEINAFCCERFGCLPPIGDDDYDLAIFRLFDRLRREFPDERWEPKRNWTARTKERRKELGI